MFPVVVVVVVEFTEPPARPPCPRPAPGVADAVNCSDEVDKLPTYRVLVALG